MRKIFNRFKLKLFIITILIIISSAVNIYSGYKLTLFYDIITSSTINSAIAFGLIMLGWKIVYIVIDYITNVQIKVLSKDMKISLRDDIVSNITNLEMNDFTKREPGEYTSWIVNDINQIEKNSIIPFFEIITNVSMFIFAIMALAKISLIVLFFASISAVLMYIVPKFYGKKIEEFVQNVSKCNEIFIQQASDNFSGFESFILYGKRTVFKARIKKNYIDLENENLKFEKEQIKMNTNVVTVFRICELFLMVLTAVLASIGKTEIGTVFVISNISTRFFNSVVGLASNSVVLKSSETLIKKHENIIQKTEKPKKNSRLTLDSCISIKNLSISYGEKLILENQNFEFISKGKYALTGESGCGKTTLLKTIAGLHKEYNGEILFDGIDINEYSTNAIVQNVAFVSQDIYIFNDTIRFNLTLGDNIDDLEIYKVLEEVNLKMTIDNLDNGLEFCLSDGGKNFSGGQRQRLSIARAMLTKKEVFFLDEATSALDKENKNIIENVLFKNTDYTVIFISHNLDNNTKKYITREYIIGDC